MGEESVKGANMGVILIIFAAILALGLIIFMLARNMANEGLTNVSERLESATNSEYSDFDQKVVVGQRVHSALSNFKGKKVAVLIATQGLIDKTALPAGTASGTPPRLAEIDAGWLNLKPKGSKDVAGTDADGMLVTTAVISGHEQATFALAAIPGRIEADNSIDMDATKRVRAPASSSGRRNDKALVFVQYNALLEPTDKLGTPVAASSGSQHSVIWWKDDHYAFDGAYRSADGKVMFDMIYSNTSTTGRTEMIPAAARFNANLLKDSNGVIMGVVFQQIGS